MSLSGSVTVFVYTYSDPLGYGSDGSFKPPGTIYEKSYDNGRYLYHSGVYFSHPSFAACNNNSVSWEDQSVNWIKLEGLYEIINLDETGSDCQVTYHYDVTSSFIQINTGPSKEVCFSTSFANCDITELSDCSGIPSILNKVEMKMIHTPRTKTIVFGDVKVKATLTENSLCNEMDLDKEGFLSVNKENKAQILYLQATQGTNESYAYKLDPSGGSDWYHYMVGGDLNYAQDVWLTGYKMCEMSGAKRPNLDKDLDVAC